MYLEKKSISKTKNSTTINYAYDASGNRITKDVAGQQTWYVRDASGNVMSVYYKDVNASQHLVQTELHLYGSSRLGIFHVNQRVENVVDNSIYLSTLPERGLIVPFERGSKRYELTNHLGNACPSEAIAKAGAGDHQRQKNSHNFKRLFDRPLRGGGNFCK